MATPAAALGLLCRSGGPERHGAEHMSPSRLHAIPRGSPRRCATRRFETRPFRRAATAAASSGEAAGGAGEKQPVRQADKLSVLQLLGRLTDLSPNAVGLEALGGCPFAWASGKGTLYVADLPTVQQWMGREWELGTVTAWPKTFERLLGAEALAITRSAEQHAALREVIGVLLTDGEVERVLPGIQAIVDRYMAQWAARGTAVNCYDEMLTLVFDVLVNQVLQLGWNDADIKKYAGVFETWNQGLTVLANPLPWSAYSRGMRARQQMVERLRQSLRDPALTPGSVPAKLRDVYGADSDVCSDNLIMVVFAGFETIACLATDLLWHLSRDPPALDKLRKEQAEVAAALAQPGKAAAGSSPPFSLASVKAMKYTQAALDEVLRLRQIVASVPRMATQDLDLPRAPTAPAGTRLSVAWGALSLQDPAVQGDEGAFRPERWLDPAAAASKADYQRPFGYGQHGCMGYRIARATACAVAQQLALKYSFEADAVDDWDNFPTGGRPRNGLPLTLSLL